MHRRDFLKGMASGCALTALAGLGYRLRPRSQIVLQNRAGPTPQPQRRRLRRMFLEDTFVATAGTLLSAHTSDSGDTWTATNSAGYPASLVISPSGSVRSDAGACYARSSATPPSANYRLEVDLIRRSSATANPRLYIRSDATLDGYAVEWDSATGELRLFKITGGSVTITFLDTVAFGWVVGATKRIALQAVGTTITVEVSTDGGGSWTNPFGAGVTDSSISAAGAVALSNDSAATDSTGFAFQNLTATNIVVGDWTEVTFTDPVTGDSAILVVANGDDAEDPKPLIRCFHGSGGTASSSVAASVLHDTILALVDAGYRLLWENGHGENWGNQQAVDDDNAASHYVMARYNTTWLGTWAGSMGNLPACNSIAFNKSLTPLGHYALCGVFDGDAAYADSDFTSLMNTAFGGNYGTNGTAYDPMDRTTADFERVRFWRFVASPSDTLVPTATHTDAFRTKLGALTLEENSKLTVTGEHGSDEHYVPSDVVAFFGRVGDFYDASGGVIGGGTAESGINGSAILGMI